MEQKYICAVCGKSHCKIEDRMICERDCLKSRQLNSEKEEQLQRFKEAEKLLKEISDIDNEIASLQNLRKNKEEKMDKYQKYLEVPDVKIIKLNDLHFANLFGSLGL